LLHWPLPDESKIFRIEDNSRPSEQRTNKQTNKQAKAENNNKRIYKVEVA